MISYLYGSSQKCGVLMGASHPDMDILQKSKASNFMTFYLEKLFVSVFMMAPEPTRNWSNRTVFTIQGLRSFERDRKPKTSRCCARVWRRCGASSGGSGLFSLASLKQTIRTMPKIPKKIQTTSELKKGQPLCTSALVIWGKPPCPVFWFCSRGFACVCIALFLTLCSCNGFGCS